MSELEMMSDDELLDEFMSCVKEEGKYSSSSALFTDMAKAKKAATHRLRVAAEIAYRMEHAR